MDHYNRTPFIYHKDIDGSGSHQVPGLEFNQGHPKKKYIFLTRNDVTFEDYVSFSFVVDT